MKLATVILAMIRIMLEFIQSNTSIQNNTTIEDTIIEEASNSANSYLFSIQNAEQGNYGVLYIPSIETHVKLNTSEYKYWQYTVDKEDSALFFNVRNAGIIADHVNQSFVNLKYVNIGDELQIMNGDELSIYKCVLNSKGYKITLNGRSGLYFTDYSDAYNYGGLTLYTCLDPSGKNVTITHWDKIN